MNGTPVAACVGEHDLFEATDSDSHDLAARICATCPIIDACRTIRDKRDPGGGYPWHNGTWAGELWINGERVDPTTRIREKRAFANGCHDCGADIPTNPNQRYCPECRKARRQEQSARHQRKRRARDQSGRVRNRGQHGAVSDLPCPTCAAESGKPCRSGTGLIGYLHVARIPAVCECGAAITADRTWCQPCADERSRARWREKAKRQYAASKAEKGSAA